MELLLDDITVTYRRRGVETTAVRGVSLHVRRGETVAVVGESGSGKTTLAKVAAELQKPTSGSLTWRPTEGDGVDSAIPRGGRTRRVQMVFQHPVQSLDPQWRIRRSVREPLRRGGVSRHAADPIAAELIERVGLDVSILDRYPREVSGGQAQRVAIARALISNPEIVILDEPTASLDQTVRARILALLAELQGQTGVGYLMISHDISSVRRLATRITVMYRGLVVESGPATAILDEARHPYTQALIAAVPVADPRVSWDGAAHVARIRNGNLPKAPCPVAGSPCGRHGPGLHRVRPDHPDHLVACTTTTPVGRTDKT